MELTNCKVPMRNRFAAGVPKPGSGRVERWRRNSYAVLISASRSGRRSNTLSTFTKASSGLVFPFA
jgi:hypothetical protein